MKPLLLIIALLLVAPSVRSQGVVRIQSPTTVAGACSVGVDISNGWCQIAHTVKGSTNTAVTSDAVVTTGADLIVVIISSYCGNHIPVSTDISDSKSNSWSAAFTQCDAGSAAGLLIAFSKPTSVGSGHTFSYSNASITTPVMTVYAVSGSHASPVDQTAFAAANSATSQATGSITPTQNNELIITGWSLLAVNVGTPTINSGMTVADFINSDGVNYQTGGLAYVTQSTAAAINPTWSWAVLGGETVVIVSFKHS